MGLASEMPLGVRSLIRIPASGLATTSGLPQIGEAIAGVPQAIASSRVRPSSSARGLAGPCLERYTDGRTTTRALR